MSEKVFEAALGLSRPWYVAGTDFDGAARTLTIRVDFTAGSRFSIAGLQGEHAVYDSMAKRYRHLNFFQHECFLEVRVPRVKLPDGSVRLVEPPWAGRLSGFTLLFEALVLMLCQQMTFAAAARLVGESRHRVAAICERYVELALAQTDLSAVRELAIDETSRARGHDYISLAADALERRVLAVTEGASAESIGRLAAELHGRGCPATQIRSVSIDMSPGFIKGCAEHLPNARITFDKFHVIWHANAAVDRTRRIEQRTEPSLKGLRWSLLKDRSRLSAAAAADLDGLIARTRTVRTARAWGYKEQLREILQRRQIHVVRSMLLHWCTRVRRSKVEPMKEVAAMVRKNLEGIVAWAQTRQTNGFLEALNGLFQSAKRRARGFKRLSTIRTVIFLIAGKLDFRAINPHTA
jgi:transposase